MPCAHERVTDLDVLGCGAHEVLDGRRPAQDLLHGRVDEGGVLLKSSQLIGMLDQREHATRHRTRRRVVAGGRDEHVVADLLLHADRHAVDLTVRDR